MVLKRIQVFNLPMPRPRLIGSTFSFIAAALLSYTTCWAAPFVLFPFDRELSGFVHSYRQSPDPAAAIDRYFAIDFDAFLERAQEADQPHSRPVLMAFYVHIVHDNPDVCVPFARRLVAEAKGEKAAFGAEVLAYGAIENRKEALSAIVDGFDLPAGSMEAYDALEPFPYPQLEATDWQVLDILWACYFASGDDAYLRKIAGALKHYQARGAEFDNRVRALSAQNPEEGTPEHAELFGLLTAQAAYFGLAENCAIDSGILRAIEAIASQNQGIVAEVLTEIVAEARDRVHESRSDDRQ